MNRRNVLIHLSGLFLIFIVFVVSCEDKANSVEPVLDWRNLDLTEEWQVGKTNVVGIDPEKLKDGIKSVKSLQGFYSIAVVYKGRLVTEEYAIGDISTKYYVWSITKSFLSAIYGQMIDLGLLGDEFGTIDAYYLSLTDSLKKSIKLSNLLTMTSGINDDLSYMQKEDPPQYILSNNLVFSPGTSWGYTSAGTHILSDVATKITNQSARDFGDKNLFSKIGIKDYTWTVDQNGVSNGGYGLTLRLRDMLKFGQLFLQEGKSGGEEIISSGWVNKSTSMLIPFNEPQSWGYGYLWWITKVKGAKVYYAAGYAGQFIIVIPSKAMVVAATSNSQPVQGYVNNLYDTIMDKIVSSFSAPNDN
ncbi:MAG: serine hydrolase [Candidatus Marinimicrobia bacterium]|nr:serine hydrolase [Candidatus Neomarinimicrobiota bacterium]